jgi:hypothetical protein
MRRIFVPLIEALHLNVRFRWIADVGEGLLNTESGRLSKGNDGQITVKSGQ